MVRSVSVAVGEDLILFLITLLVLSALILGIRLSVLPSDA